MNFALGTELTNNLQHVSTPDIGPANTSLPQLSGLAEIGSTLTVNDGSWTGSGGITLAYQWVRGGVAIPGETLNSYVLQGADDQAVVSCQVIASDDVGTSTASAPGLGVTYSTPVFSQQPTLSPANGVVGAMFTMTLGAAGQNTVLSIVSFSLDGADRLAELSGLTWDSAGGVAGGLSFQVMATNSGGSVLSDFINADLISASATVPDVIQDANWTVTDTGAGGALNIWIAVMAANGGAPVSAVEYQLDGAGPWLASGLTDAGGFVIGGLQDAQAYLVALRVVNSVGAGTPSAAKGATPAAGVNPTVALTTINRTTGEVEMTGVSDVGMYFGLVNYSAAPMGAAALEAAVNGGASDAFVSFSVATGANAAAYDTSNVAVGTAYFHGVIRNSVGDYSADFPLAFTRPFIDVVAPVLLSSAPANGALNQPVGSNISLTFDEDMQMAAGQVVLFDMTAASVVETFDTATGLGNQGGTVSVSGKVVSIDPGADLPQGAQFALRTVTVGALKDTSGNGFAGWSNDNSQLGFGTAAAGAGAVFIGDADSTTWSVNHVLGAGSSSQTALPAAYGVGKYVIAVAVSQSKDVVTLALDGVAAALRASMTSASERVAIFDVIIPGGGNGLIELSLSGAGDDVGVAVWDVGGRSFVSALPQSFDNRKTDLPADLGIGTLTGDVVMVAAMHTNPNVTSTWTGLTEVVASRPLTGRVFTAAHNLSASGATPETFLWAPTIDWTGLGAALAVYR